jgi:hypothetical protein
MNWEQIITNAPYNTINLPGSKEPEFENPQEQHILSKNIIYEGFGTKSENSRQSHIIPLETENNFYDPTVPMVNDYLKMNDSMYDNRGKYFNQYLFNQKFDDYIKKSNNQKLLKEKVQLYDLDRFSNIQITPYQLPIDKLLINLKNIWFIFFDNLINLNNPFDNFNTTDLFYYGITFVAIYILIIMLSFIFD